LDCIVDGSKPLSTIDDAIDDAIDALKVVQAAYRDAKGGGVALET
jgi:hypothetical protein